MNKFEQFIDRHFNKIALLLLVVTVFNTCGNPTKPLNKRIDALNSKVDSLNSIVVNRKDLQLEGLKAEKRMIQSVDRKILDVNRQTEIDKEIETLLK